MLYGASKDVDFPLLRVVGLGEVAISQAGLAMVPRPLRAPRRVFGSRAASTPSSAARASDTRRRGAHRARERFLVPRALDRREDPSARSCTAKGLPHGCTEGAAILLERYARARLVRRHLAQRALPRALGGSRGARRAGGGVCALRPPRRRSRNVGDHRRLAGRGGDGEPTRARPTVVLDTPTSLGVAEVVPDPARRHPLGVAALSSCFAARITLAASACGGDDDGETTTETTTTTAAEARQAVRASTSSSTARSAGPVARGRPEGGVRTATLDALLEGPTEQEEADLGAHDRDPRSSPRTPRSPSRGGRRRRGLASRSLGEALAQVVQTHLAFHHGPRRLDQEQVSTRADCRGVHALDPGRVAARVRVEASCGKGHKHTLRATFQYEPTDRRRIVHRTRDRDLGDGDARHLRPTIDEYRSH